MHSMDCEDGTVEFWLYPSPTHCDPPEETLAKVYSSVASLVRNWVWHREKFSLSIQRSADAWHLAGSLDYGENVLDEWFVVSLLFHITKHVDLVGRITDGDGEFLLIEAASVLPSWAADPSKAEGRVFLYKGNLHLIPICSSPGTITPCPSSLTTPTPHLAAAVAALYPALSLVNPSMQASITSRLDGLPHDTGSNHHRCTVQLPRGLATLIGRDSAILGRLVQAVRERDPLDTRAARAMDKVRQEDMVDVRLTFSKCLFAMLSGIQLRPYKGSGWQVGEEQKEQLGFRIATGLQILLTRCRGEGARSDKSEGFDKFLAKLNEVNYFQGELEGSKLYKELMEGCKVFWNSASRSEEYRDGDDLSEQWGVARSKPESLENFLVGAPGPEDPEDWLNVTPESLDAMLEAKFGVAKKQAGKDVPEEFAKFLGKMSDMDGVEEDEDITIDHENLMKRMKKMMREMGELENGDDDSEEEDEEEMLGDEDPVMADYLGRLDTEVEGQASDRGVGEMDRVMENLLKSYNAQGGLGGHGPVSSLFKTLGVNPGPPE